MRKFNLLLLICIVFLAFTGCSTIDSTKQTPYPSSTTTISPSDCYFICDHKGNTGVAIYTPNEEHNMIFENSYIEHIIRSDGTFVYPNGSFLQLNGQIPSDSLVFITNNDTYEVGVWDVDKGEWLLEPSGKFMAYHENYCGQMLDFTINGTLYNLNLEPIDNNEPDIFFLSDGTIFQNVYQNGTYHIADEKSNLVLDSNMFWQKNNTLNILPGVPMFIELKDIVDSKHLLITYHYAQNLEDDSTIRSSCTYLCDLEGNIYFPHWNYTYADYPRDQYNNIIYNLFYFTTTTSNEFHYMDLRTEKPVEIPNGYLTGIAKTENLFLFSNGNEHTIYNISTHEIGTTFSSTTPASEINVFGLNSYSIGLSLVIDEELYEIEALSELSIKSSPFPVINVVTPSGDISQSYILDTEGHLVAKTSEHVTYADSSYYCVYDNSNTTPVVDIYPLESVLSP